MAAQNTAQKNVLVAPLDWGLGHASRCVPVIRALLEGGAKVTLAASGNALQLLQSEFPMLPVVRFEGYAVRYPEHGNWLWYFIRRLPSLVLYVSNEKKRAHQIIKEHQIDIVISDNRYFVRSRQTYNVCISHQLHPPFPFLKGILTRITHYLLACFDEVWVPDHSTSPRLAGKLSAPIAFSSTALHYIGLLSRFSNTASTTSFRHDFLVLISGPEPYRSQLEKRMLTQLKSSEKQGLVVLGLPGISRQFTTGKYSQIKVVNHLSGIALQSEIAASRIVLCRSGYTSIMELVVLQKQAILIPTPDQPEQAYLGTHLKDSNAFLIVQQADFQFDNHYELAEKRCVGSIAIQETQPLKKHIDRCLHQITPVKSR